MEKGYQLYVKKDVSKKGAAYCTLCIDLGYREVFLTSKDNSFVFCSELMGVSVQEFVELPNGKYPIKINNKE